MKRCRVCLTENFIQPLEDSKLIEFSKTFFKTFGVFEDLDERHLFCFECKSLLWKSYTLIQKAVCAQQALIKLQQKQTINAECLQNMRNQYGLFSSLGYHKVQEDYFITRDDSTDEEVVQIEVSVDTKDILLQQEYFIDTIDNMDETYSPTQKSKGKKGKKRGKVEPFVKKAKKPCKKKDIIVDTGPRPVDVTVDHIIEGKRKRTKKLLEPEITESDTDDIPLQQRKIKKEENYWEQEIDPLKLDSDSNSSVKYYSPTTGKRLKRPLRNYPKTCELCSSEIQSGRDHYQHYVNYHKETEYPFKLEKNIVCNQCGKSFSHRKRLTDHLQTHSKEKTIHCQICNKMFYTMRRKSVHVRRVHLAKKYFCDYCGKGFTTKWCLILHVRTHTGDKPYSCDICGIRFVHGGNLLVHVRKKHQKTDATEKQKRVKKKETIKKEAEDISDGEKNKKSGEKATVDKTSNNY